VETPNVYPFSDIFHYNSDNIPAMIPHYSVLREKTWEQCCCHRHTSA